MRPRGAMKTSVGGWRVATLGAFRKRIDDLAETVKRRGPEIKRKLAATCLQTVVFATPVGNMALWNKHSRETARPGYVGGRARHNWQVSTGEALTGTLDDVDAEGSETINAGQDAIDNSGDGEAIHIVNNLPYIVPLNEGHSKQAPAGFVEQAVQAAV